MKLVDAIEAKALNCFLDKRVISYSNSLRHQSLLKRFDAFSYANGLFIKEQFKIIPTHTKSTHVSFLSLTHGHPSYALLKSYIIKKQQFIGFTL